MEAVTISPKFQVVIPRNIRERLGLKAGQKVQMIPIGDHIMLVPLRPVTEVRGSLPGLNTDVEREEEDRV
jgi:AbrB family looped-hinge helix DNA binding protein